SPHNPLASQAIRPLATGQQNRGSCFNSQTASIHAAKIFMFSDFWSFQCCSVVVRHKPSLVDVANFATDLSHKSPASIGHVTESAGSCLEKCDNPGQTFHP
ncbi:hypothetical protein pdam_00001663, partial [Pocillopora damicornis]